MFAPFTGYGLGLSFWETYLSSVAGGTFGAGIFFYASEVFMKISEKKRKQKEIELKENGIVVPKKKKFTKTNRFIIRLKKRLGIYGICFWAPFLLSVPIGSIVAAKFYGKLGKTFPLIILGMCINAMITCSLAYHIF
jgi:hypothetical protein